MDRRYLLIIVIIILGSINMFFIAESSDIIGSASVSFDGYTVSIPKGFSLMNTNENSVVINNPNSNLYIAIYSIDKDYDYEKFLDNINENNSYKVLSKGTINIKNVTVDSLYYYGPDSRGNVGNRSIFFFEKLDSKFEIQMTNFDYNHREKTIEALTLIVDSLRDDYKMK